MPLKPLDETYTTHQIAQMIQVDPSTVTKWAEKGLIQFYRTPGGHRRITGRDLLSFLQAHKMPIPEELVPA
jgi:excisionase family DNA binding protein